MPLGTGLLLAGVLVNILAAVRHVRTVHALNTGAPIDTKPSTMAIVVALVLAACGFGDGGLLSQGVGLPNEYRRRNHQQTKQIFGAVKRCIAWRHILTAKGIKDLRAGGSQRRSRKSRIENAAHAVADLRQSQRRHAGDARRAHVSHRSAVEGAGVAGYRAARFGSATTMPAYIQRRFGLSDDVMKPLAGLGAVIEQALA